MTNRQKLAPTLLAFCLAGLAACGGSSGDAYEDGLAAAKSGDHSAAVVHFDKALGALEPSSPDFTEIQLARIEALSKTDPEKAMMDFLTRSEDHADAFATEDYQRVFGWLFDEKGYVQAGKLLNELKERHPESVDFVATMDKRIREAMASADMDPEQRKLLEGLGYVSSN